MGTATSWVSKEPGRCGGEACVRETRIPVWGLVNLRRLGATDDELLRAYPSLAPADLEAAKILGITRQTLRKKLSEA